MAVSRKNKSMKKSSKSRKNIKSSKKTRKNTRKMRGGVNPMIIGTDEFNQFLNGCIDSKDKEVQDACLNVTDNLLFDNNIDLSGLLNQKICDKLKNLSLDNHQLSDANMEIITEFLTKTNALENLELEACYNQQNLPLFIDFMHAIGENKTLEFIVLTGNDKFLNLENMENLYHMYINIKKNKETTEYIITDPETNENKLYKNNIMCMMLIFAIASTLSDIIENEDSMKKFSIIKDQALEITPHLEKINDGKIKNKDVIAYFDEHILEFINSMFDN